MNNENIETKEKETKTEPKEELGYDPKKLRPCAACGHLISVKAKKCPECGEKNKVALKYSTGKKFLIGCGTTIVAVILAIILIIVAIVGSIHWKNNKYTEPETYKTVDYSILFEECTTDLESAKEKYIGDYYSFTGSYSSGGNIFGEYWYVRLGGILFTNEITINAEFKSKRVKEAKPSPQMDDEVVVKGKITDIRYNKLTNSFYIDLTVYEAEIVEEK